MIYARKSEKLWIEITDIPDLPDRCAIPEVPKSGQNYAAYMRHAGNGDREG
ncbi:MAG: hypothetical protein MJZ79_06095 [Paludibacteraceae bacterium]|nr:hypothetical protein [Paludibacteraceae bacterium]